MSDFVRVKLNCNKTAIWAIRKYSEPFYFFTKVDKEGNPPDKIYLFIVCEEDIAWIKPAVMNNHYAQLEIAS
jgi:hypothetical protein